MTPEHAIQRARAAIGLKTVYGLGHGGRRRHYPKPHDEQGKCDCSGFIAYCLDVDRYMPDNPWYKSVNGGWLETTAIVRDCATPFGLFDPVAMSAVRVGDLLVWGDRKGMQGHVGIVSRIGDDGPAAVIHCSSGNYRQKGDAIQETPPGLFLVNGSIAARYAMFEFVPVATHHREVPGVTPGPSQTA